MKGITRRVLLSVILFHIIALVIIVLASVFFQDKDILPEFAWSWVVSKTVVSWIDYFVPITLTAIAFSFSVLLSSTEVRSEIKGERSFVRVANGSIALIIIISSAFILAFAFLYGPSRQSIDGIKTHSQDAKTLLESAKVKIAAHDKTTANEDLEHALLLAPQYNEVRRLHDQLLLESSGNSGADATQAPEQKKESPSEGQSRVLKYADQIKKAEEYYKSGDYFSALYFIKQAGETSGQAGPEFSELKTRIENGIRGKEQNPADADKRKLYEMKQAAIIGSLQNNMPIDAYYQLLDIEKFSQTIGAKSGSIIKEAGLSGGFQDPDVRKWMPEVLKGLQNTTFFTDELSQNIQRVSNSCLMFLNREKADIREFIFAQSLTEGKFGFFMLNPEIIVVDPEGKILEHRKADFGKVIGHNLLLRAIDRNKKDLVHDVVMIAGAIPAATRSFVKIEPSIENLWDLSQGQSGYEGMTIPQQIGLLQILQKLGYDAVPLQSVLLMFIVKVLSISAFSFLVMGWAWARRSRYLTQPVFLMILMVILLPVFMYVLTTLYWALQNALVSCFLILLGFGTSIIIILAIQALILGLSLVYVAGQSAD